MFSNFQKVHVSKEIPARMEAIVDLRVTKRLVTAAAAREGLLGKIASLVMIIVLENIKEAKFEYLFVK